MSSVRLEISSEIYSETDFRSTSTGNGTMVSRFSFIYPTDDEFGDDGHSILHQIDVDGDVIVKRKRRDAIEIEHQKSTDLTMVGLQVWRGALILADFLFHNRRKFGGQNILEMGSGVGLSSIAAAIHSEQNVCCTDIDLGGILRLIGTNVLRNKRLMPKCQVNVMPMDFSDRNWSIQLQKCVRDAEIILAADVIYDDDITDEFIQTLVKILDPIDYNVQRNKEIYIALEKRYVFTLAELDTGAPCYDHFLRTIEPIRIRNGWTLESIPISFPQYFDYERVRELVLLKLYL